MRYRDDCFAVRRRVTVRINDDWTSQHARTVYQRQARGFAEDLGGVLEGRSTSAPSCYNTVPVFNILGRVALSWKISKPDVQIPVHLTA